MRLDPDIVRGRDAVRAAQILGEALRAFELGGRGIGPEHRNSGRAQRIGDARDERRFGTDYDEVDGIASGERDDRGRIAGIDGDAFAPSARSRDCRARRCSRSQLGDCLRRQASASSRPPDPKSRIFMDLPEDTRAGLLAEVAPGDNSPPLSVTELSGALKRTIENAFGQVRVRGEISGFKRHSSGHCYFTLKDENACIDAVIWRTSAGALAFRPEDGAEVIATGKLTTYPGRSKYQIVVDRMELAGEGALLALLERRRKALAAEGLFDAARKRRLPFLPQVIGVVTSPTGAVIRDIIHRLEDRCPTRVIVWPVPVQGEGAAAKIAEAIRGFPAIEPRPGPADRRARRRLDRGSVGVQRGGGGARRGRIADPADFRRRARDRHDADRPCRRPSRADSDGRGGNRGPGPGRALRAAGGAGASRPQCLARRAERCRERFELTICRWPEPQVIVMPMVQRVDELRSGCRVRWRRAPATRAPTSISSPAACAASLSTSASPGSPSSCPQLGRWPSSRIPSVRCSAASPESPAATGRP